MRHSKENLIDLDSGDTEQELEFDDNQPLNGSIEYLDNQIDTGLQKQVLFKFRPAEPKPIVFTPPPEEEDKYKELDAYRV